MTFDEINASAARREAMPEGLPPAERTAWLGLCLLYELHGLGRIGRKDGVRLKEGFAREFAAMQARERVYIAAETALKLLRQSDCPAAKALLRQIETEETT